MIRPGDIVWQKKTMINNKNFKDNKDKRLSVVIFSEIIDGEAVVCTCPFTNSVGTACRNPTEYYSNAFLVLGGRKLSCIKLNSVHLYPEADVYPLGVCVNDFQYECIRNKLLEYVKNSNQNDLYHMIQEYTFSESFIDNVLDSSEVITKQEKRKNRNVRRERIRQAKRGTC